MEEREHVFDCREQEFEGEPVLALPNLAYALTNNAFEKGAVEVKSTTWIGSDPPEELLQREEPTADKARIDNQVDIAMALLKDTEPERTKLTIKEICAPTEGPIKVIGQADYETDVPLLAPRLGEDGPGSSQS